MTLYPSAFIPNLQCAWLKGAFLALLLIPAAFSHARGDPLDVAALVAPPLAELDRSIADLVMQRAKVPPAQRATFDLDLDLRIIHRWFWAQLARAADADLQAAFYARALAMDEARLQLDQVRRARAGQDWSRTQSEALVRLHQITYALPDIKTTAELDKISSDVGWAVLRIASEQPIDAGTAIPPMRPRRAARSDSPANDNREPTLNEIAQEAQIANVSPTLRSQLVHVARMAQDAAEGDPDSRESQRLTALLRDAMGMVRGLATNTGVSPETRLELEHQLAEALALSSDPRLQSAGAERMEALRPYRNTLTRIGRLQLTAQQRDRFARALAHAQANPGEADTVFDALDAFIRNSERHHRVAVEPPEDPQLRKSHDQLRQIFADAHTSFITHVDALGGASVFASSPAEMAGEARNMERAVELLELLQKVPATVDTLDRYKPRPLGGLQRRMQGLTVAIASPAAINVRNQNENTFRLAVRLADAARTLEQHPMTELPADQARAYTGGQAEAFDQRWRAIVFEQASAIAGGGEIDPKRIEELDRMRELVQAVRDAITLGANQGDWSALARWADWTMTAEQFQSVLMPLQQALSSAVTGAAGGSETDPAAVRQMRARYAPIVAFVRRAHGYADQLDALPSGMTAAAAKLITPMPENIFASERLAGLAAAVWLSAETEPAEKALQDLAARVAPEVGMRYRAPRARGR